MTKTDAAYQEIRVAIELGRLEPGTRLVVGDLEDMLEMSPTPIREALRLLQRDGLVEHQPHLGMFVASFTEDRIAENDRIRQALEPLATSLAAERATPAELAEIGKLHAQFEAAVAKDPAGRLAPRLNAEWHAAVYRSSHADQLVEFIDRLWTAMGRTRFFSVHGTQSVEEHQAVMDALVERRAEDAARLMGAHLKSVDFEIVNRAPKPAPSSAGA